MDKADDIFTTCPVPNFEEIKVNCDRILTEPKRVCNQVYHCLSKVLTTPHGKPSYTNYPDPNVTLYQNGKSNPFASCLVIWQACNLMTKRQYHHWQVEDNYFTYTHVGRSGELIYRLPKNAIQLEKLDIRTLLIHLLLAACATQKSCPWEEEILINDRLISEFLGLNHRRDMNRLKKLLLIQSLVEQASLLTVEIHWQKRGTIKAIDTEAEPLWHISTIYHLAKTEAGENYLSGVSFRVFASSWAKYFLSRDRGRNKTSYYQYGWLPISLAPKIMSLWQKHQGAVVLLLYLLFRLRVGHDRGAKVASLLKLIYGEEYLQSGWYQAGARRKMISAFEADLEQLFYYGVKPIFDPVTYPASIQPHWVSDQNIPDDPEQALNYWTETANTSEQNLTSKQKWTQLLNARITSFELPADWHTETLKLKNKPYSPNKTSTNNQITGAMVKAARIARGFSQRELSSLLNKSQSWLRDIESGRYKIKAEDTELLISVLGNIN